MSVRAGRSSEGANRPTNGEYAGGPVGAPGRGVRSRLQSPFGEEVFQMSNGAGNVRRFGVVAIGKGLITRDQLFEALRIQVADNVDTGSHRQVGVILQEIGVLDEAQIENVLADLALP